MEDSAMLRYEEDGGAEIDIMELLKVFWRNIWTILLVSTIACALYLGYTLFFVTPSYQATASVYVNNDSFSVGQTKFTISASELTNSSLVSTYIYILDTRETMEEVIKQAGLNYSYQQLLGMISTSTVDNTSIFKITVTSSSPTEAEKIANTIVAVLPSRVAEVVEGSTVRVASYAIVPTHRSSPDYTKNALMGFAVGAALSCGVIFLFYFINKRANSTVDSADDLKSRYPGISVLAVIPDMRYSKKGSYYYSSYYTSKGEGAKE